MGFGQEVEPLQRQPVPGWLGERRMEAQPGHAAVRKDVQPHTVNFVVAFQAESVQRIGLQRGAQ